MSLTLTADGALAHAPAGTGDFAAGARRLPFPRLAAFASISIPISAAQLPLAVYLPPLYAQEYGLSLGALGFILLLTRIWDTASDPLIGVLSDRTATRFGRRRPWMAGGAVLFGLAAFAIFFPPVRVTIPFVGVTLFFLYLGWTMMQIPFLAWSAELSGHYHDRTRVASVVQIMTVVALLLTLILPAIADHVRPGDGLLKLHLMGGTVLVTLIPTLLLTLFSFPELPAPARRGPQLGVMRSAALIVKERLLLKVLASDFAVSLAQTIRGTLFVFVVSFIMGVPQWASALFLVQFVFALFAGPIWARIGYRLGKHRSVILAELVQVAINLGLLALAPGHIVLLVGLTAAQGLAQYSGNLLLRSIVADIADKHRLETGADHTALFYSVFSLSAKLAMAVGVGIALPLVAWLGFDPKAAHNGDGALRGLLLVFALGPAIAHSFSAWLIRGFSLDERAHADIRRQLDQGA